MAPGALKRGLQSMHLEICEEFEVARVSDWCLHYQSVRAQSERQALAHLLQVYSAVLLFVLFSLTLCLFDSSAELL